jgi:hypothetical protein
MTITWQQWHEGRLIRRIRMTAYSMTLLEAIELEAAQAWEAGL